MFRVLASACICFLTANITAADDSLEDRLGKYCREAQVFDRACQYDFSLSLQVLEDSKDPLFIEMLGRIARKNDAFYLRFDQRRTQERDTFLLTYESGLRTPDAIKSAFGVTTPKPEVRDVPQETRRNRQFEENYYSLNPAYFAVRSFVGLRAGDPFDKDKLIPLEILSQSTLANGSEQFAYYPVNLGGAMVYEITFSKEATWLPTEFRIYNHPLVAAGLFEELKQRFSEVNPADYKNWVLSWTTLTNWEKVDERYVPSVIRMLQHKHGNGDAYDAIFTFRNWKFDPQEMDPAFDIQKFVSENLPGAEFFEQIEKSFADDLEKKK